MLITFSQLIFEDLGQISIVTLITTMILGITITITITNDLFRHMNKM